MRDEIGSDPDTLIAAGGLWRVVLNRNQNLLGRSMIVLSREETDVTRITTDEWIELRLQILRVKGALDSLFKPDHYNYAFLMNQDAQVHLHVIPRYRRHRDWNGRRFWDRHFSSMVRPDSRILERNDLARLTAEIAGALG